MGGFRVFGLGVTLGSQRRRPINHRSVTTVPGKDSPCSQVACCTTPLMQRSSLSGRRRQTSRGVQLTSLIAASWLLSRREYRQMLRIKNALTDSALRHGAGVVATNDDFWLAAVSSGWFEVEFSSDEVGDRHHVPDRAVVVSRGADGLSIAAHGTTIGHDRLIALTIAYAERYGRASSDLTSSAGTRCERSTTHLQSTAPGTGKSPSGSNEWRHRRCRRSSSACH